MTRRSRDFWREGQGRETREARNGRKDMVERQKGLKRGAFEEEGQGRETKRTEERGS